MVLLLENWAHVGVRGIDGKGDGRFRVSWVRRLLIPGERKGNKSLDERVEGNQSLSQYLIRVCSRRSLDEVEELCGNLLR